MKGYIIEYSQDEFTNYYSPKESAVKLATLFCKYPEKSVGYIEEFLNQHRHQNPDTIKPFKEYMEANWKDIMRGNKPQDQCLQTLLEIEGRDEYSYNLLHSLTRLAEWFMYSERYLREEYAPEMESHLEDINALAIDNSIYPYDPKVGICHDILKDLDNQEESVKNFVNTNGIANSSVAKRRVTAKSIKKAMKTIEEWINISIDKVPKYAQPWVSMMKDIREEIFIVNERMETVLREGFKADQLTLSESICYLNDEDWARMLLCNQYRWRDKDGGTRISAIIGNLVHLYYEGLPIPLTSGQINCAIGKQNMLFSKAAPGLGPAFKIRIVFSTSSEIQNFADIPARFLHKHHLNCYHYAYLDQTGYILANAKTFQDVQCTDCTGYSDYLDRNIYLWIMSLMGFSNKVIAAMNAILSMPIKVGNKIYNVPFGSLQGVKFLVYIMNDANAVIGLIQNLLRVNKWTDRQNAGDDVYAATTKGHFTAADLEIDMLVWLYFNCPTNMSKSAWLKRDGYWDFCKVFYGKNGMPLTGIPPKMYNKDITCIRDISEIYKNFDRTGVIPHRNINEFYNKLEPYLLMQLENGMSLKNPICDLDLKRKVEAAKKISYKIGGLSADELSVEFRIQHLVKYCYKLYNEFEIQVGDIYSWAYSQKIEGVLGEFFLQIRQTSAKEFIAYLAQIENLRQSYENGELDIDLLDKLESDLERETRIFLDSGQRSKSGSTYHRITPDKNGDVSIIELEEGLSLDDIPINLPSSMFDTSAVLQLSTLENLAMIEKLRTLAYLSSNYEHYKSLVCWCGGGNNGNGTIYPYIWEDENKQRRFRLFSSRSDKVSGDIYPLRGCRDPALRYFAEFCIKYGIFDMQMKIDRAAKETVANTANRIAKQMKEHYKGYISREWYKRETEDEFYQEASERLLKQYRSMIKD